MNKEVSWNPDELIIGVVGVAPAATADFYTKLIQLTPVQKDWQHARVIIDSNPKIPSRGRFFELGETDPVPFIRESIENLHRLGAGVVALPCNTAHILYERYAADLPVVVPNMIDVTVQEALQLRPGQHRNVGVFSSRLTAKHELYHKRFAQFGWNVLDTESHQSDISALIEEVKQGKPLVELKKRMSALLALFSTADLFIVGCTELSLLTSDYVSRVPIIDSNIALAKACLSLSRNEAFNLIDK